MLSVEHFGIAIPLFWMVLKGGGTSSHKHRIKMMKRIIKIIGKKNIRVLLSDREFIGEPWFRFLIEEDIPFVIRLKEGFLAEGIRQDYPIRMRELLKLRGHKRALINHSIILWKHPLLASADDIEGAKESMIVVSNKIFEDPLSLYRWRWGIETLFEILKSRGFRIEETHMTQPDKIEKLLFIFQ